MRLRKRHSLSTSLHFPKALETAEETIARFEREQAAYVSKHWTRR